MTVRLKHRRGSKDGENLVYSCFFEGAKGLWVEGILGFTNSSLGTLLWGLWERVDLVNFRARSSLYPSYLTLALHQVALHTSLAW